MTRDFPGMRLRAAGHDIQCSRGPRIMGILNVTPDSFYDGGKYLDPEPAVRRGLELIEAGADLLDVGGESTRPDAQPVDLVVELNRVLPVIESLAAQTRVPLSIDTQKPAVAKAALRAGAVIVNDIAANRHDPAMEHLVAETGAAYVAMHMQGTPQTMQRHPHYANVIAEVAEFFEHTLGRLRDIGITEEQIILDPGFGFGKTVEHNLQLLTGLETFHRFNRPLLVGISRKSFIGHLTGTEPADRLPGSLAGAFWATLQGVQLIRVHDVRETKQVIQMAASLIQTGTSP